MNDQDSKPQGTKTQEGLSLLEVIGCAAILAVVINLAAGVFVMNSRLSTLGTTALNRMYVVEDIRDGFTGAVRGSRKVIPTLSRYRSGGEQLILEMPRDPSGNDAKRYVVFGVLGSGSRLSKLGIVQKNGEYSPESFVTYPIELDSIRFSYDVSDTGQARLVSLEFDIRNDGKRRGTRPSHRLTVAIRGVFSAS